MISICRKNAVGLTESYLELLTLDLAEPVTICEMDCDKCSKDEVINTDKMAMRGL